MVFSRIIPIVSSSLRVATNFDEIVDFILFTTEQNTCRIKERTELE